MSFRPKTDDFFTREKDHRCYGYITTGAFRSETEMAWECVDVYIIKRTLHGHLEIRNFPSGVEKYFTRSLRSLVVRDIFFNTRRESSYLLAAM